MFFFHFDKGTVIAGTLFALLVFGECNRVYIITLLALAVMLNGASLSGVGPNVIDLSPNFCGKVYSLIFFDLFRMKN